jgi:catechol 2,3-dioxygenase-like lactoylglutathione lyase family enzyme
MITKFWHAGVAVKDLEKAIGEYGKLGFVLDKRFEKPEPHLLAAIMNHPHGSSVELFEFLDTTHPQVEFIKRHMAFMSDDFDNDLQGLLDEGYELAIPKTTGVTVVYAFIKDSSGNYIEIATEKP